jgi:hypothetical protein
MTLSSEVVILTSFVFGAVTMYAVFMTAVVIKATKK